MTNQNEGIVEFEAVSFKDGIQDTVFERVAEESPLEIRIRYGNEEPFPFAVTMRTPGMDRQLATGYLYSERIIESSEQILGVESGNHDSSETRNTVTVTIDPEFRRADRSHQTRRINSSCGLCSKSSVNELFLKAGGIIRTDRRVESSLVCSLPDKLKKVQRIFSSTGGLHAAGIFDLSGNIIYSGEDIGRHNAVDKVIGSAVIDRRLNFRDTILQVSGRCGFEILQKAAVAGIPFVSAVSAPSSLSVEAARSLGITLACFVRGERFTIYSHPDRISYTTHDR